MLRPDAATETSLSWTMIAGAVALALVAVGAALAWRRPKPAEPRLDARQRDVLLDQLQEWLKPGKAA